MKWHRTHNLDVDHDQNSEKDHQYQSDCPYPPRTTAIIIESWRADCFNTSKISYFVYAVIAINEYIFTNIKQKVTVPILVGPAIPGTNML